MSPIYLSETVTVTFDPRGFVEWRVHKHQIPTNEELAEVSNRIADQGLNPVRVLVDRVNEYSAPEDFNLLNIGVGDLSISRLAYFAPTPGDQVFSQLMSMTALRNVPTKVFSDRDSAISWLLAEEAKSAA